MLCRIKPKATEKMEKAFATAYSAKKDEIDKTFKTVDLFDAKQTEVQSYHFIFVLDESGSMSNHWKSLEQAYQGFLARRRNDQGGDDYVTIVQFNSSARTICHHQRLDTNPSLSSLPRGGTNYCSGLSEAEKEIVADNTASSIMLIFMSDGGDGSGGNPVEMIKQLKAKCDARHSFVCHTIGFGSDVSQGSNAEKLLKEMAAAGQGGMYSAQNADGLVYVFSKIAASSAASDALIERFSEILAESISLKITTDFF